MHGRTRWLDPPLLFFLTWLVACGTALQSGRYADEKLGGDSDASGNAGIPAAPTDGSERELESSFEAPVATGRYLWVANPLSGRVAYIDAASLAVSTVAAGNGPTHVAAIGNEDATIVINVRSNDATLLRLTATGITTKTYPLAPGMNHWSISKDGRYAIAWTDAKKVPLAQKTQGFQEITVVDLATDIATVLSVGYRPTQITFDAAAAQAFAMTADGISVIALATPAVIRNVRLADDLATAAKATDVSVNAAGTHAIVRFEGTDIVTVVRLADGTKTPLLLGTPVTDLDLLPAGDEAIAVMRESSSLALISVSDAPAPQSIALASQKMGSVTTAADAAIALLYTNASAVEEVSILSLGPPATARPARVYSRVLGAFATQDGAHAVVLHEPPASDGTGAFSLLPLAADLPAKIVATNAAPLFVALTADSSRALVVTADVGKKRQAAYLARMPALSTQAIELGSKPLAAGIVEGARRAFVAQSHPAGRVTFIHLDSGETRTLTGFELGARIATGGQP
ncbi:MAG: hypothetical protein IT381_07750 [Deltaproteobacteria bacterium]|nr:hypothetical protein [Deltaproteobacteria bacterium]